MIGVFHILSQILGIAAFALLLPAAVGIGANDQSSVIFLIIAGLVGFVAGAIFFALQGRRRDLTRTNGLIIVIVVWTLLPIVAATPIALATSLNYLDSLYEAVSGLTTTGSTVFPTLTGVGPAIIFWRAETQWLGGLLTLVTFAAILAPLGVAGLTPRGLSVTVQKDARLGRTLYLIGGIAVVYSLATGLCIVLLTASGISVFDAVCLALSSVSTGGFMPRDGHVGDYGAAAANWVIAAFMLFGATSLVWHRLLIDQRSTRQFLRHQETLWVFGAIAIAAIVYFFVFESGRAAITAIGEGLFQAVSLVSTTGYELRDGGLVAMPGSMTIFFALAGGAALSTAGGLKFYRISGMIIQSTRELHRLVFPNSVRNATIDGSPIEIGAIKAIWAHLAVSIGVIVVGAVVLALDFPTIASTFVASVAAFSNIGPLYASQWAVGEPWLAVAEFSDTSKLTMIVIMVLGRIELFVFLALFNIADWRT